MLKRIIIAAATGLVLSGVALLVVNQLGDDADTRTTTGRGVTTVDDVRKFKEFPVYWLGESFQGLPLVAVQRMDYPGRWPGEIYNAPWHEVSFIYGDCTIAPGEESCPAPLSIGTRPYCDVPPEVVADWAKTWPPEVIRGAMVQRMGKWSMLVWTSNVSIGIAATDEALVDEAVRSLVRLNGDKPSSPEEALGAPDKIECPPQPGIIP
jgi:hypothetical protein